MALTPRVPAGRPAGGQFAHRQRPDGAPAVRLTLDSSAEALRAAAHHHDPDIRVAAAYHPRAGTLRAALKRDSDEHVRTAAENADQYGAADLATAFDFVTRLTTARP